MQDIIIRNIRQDDNPLLAVVIRNTLAEFGANHPGTVFFDKSTDTLFEIFQKEKSWYFIAEQDGKVLGGGGIYPTAGLPANTCELVKMYLLPEARGAGIGRTLIEKCIEKANEFGFRYVYLESMPELKKALSVYEKTGFQYLTVPMGSSGHFGCQIWMLKKI